MVGEKKAKNDGPEATYFAAVQVLKIFIIHLLHFVLLLLVSGCDD